MTQNPCHSCPEARPHLLVLVAFACPTRHSPNATQSSLCQLNLSAIFSQAGLPAWRLALLFDADFSALPPPGKATSHAPLAAALNAFLFPSGACSSALSSQLPVPSQTQLPNSVQASPQPLARHAQPSSAHSSHLAVGPRCLTVSSWQPLCADCSAKPVSLARASIGLTICCSFEPGRGGQRAAFTINEY